MEKKRHPLKENEKHIQSREQNLASANSDHPIAEQKAAYTFAAGKLRDDIVINYN